MPEPGVGPQVDKKYQQTRAGVEYHFEFLDELLHFKRTEKGGVSHELTLPYDSISHTLVTSVDYPDMIRFSGYCFLLIGIGEILFAVLTVLFSSNPPPAHGLFFFLGIALIVYARRRVVRQTRLLTTEGNIYILKDEHHDEILNQIFCRRRAKILSDYEKLDLENDPYAEIGKYRWLERLGVLSCGDADQYIAEIERHHSVSERNYYPLLQELGDLEITQSRVDYQASFHFKAEYLHHKISNNTSGIDLYLDYLSIPFEYERLVDSPDHLKFAAALLAFFAFLTSMRTLLLDETQILPILLAGFAVGFYFEYRRRTTTLRIYRRDSGDVRVVEDTKLDFIHTQLMERRKRQFLSLYGKVDADELPEDEIAKFNWLVEQRVLSQQQADTKIAEVEVEALRKSGQDYLN